MERGGSPGSCHRAPSFTGTLCWQQAPSPSPVGASGWGHRGQHSSWHQSLNSMAGAGGWGKPLQREATLKALVERGHEKGYRTEQHCSRLSFVGQERRSNFVPMTGY